jgi:PTH2 family peptidyl-tRNA hydrolase
MKQAIVVRKDIELGKGKLAAAVAHAAVSTALKCKEKNPKLFKEWFSEGQKKVVLKVENEEDLLRIKKAAGALGITNELIHDAGLTQIPPGTITALGLGPDEDEKIDKLVGTLPLL